MKTFSIKPLFIYSLIFIALFLVSCNKGDFVDTGSGTETVGTLVDKSGNPVNSANVILTDLFDSTVVLNSISDKNGEYLFENLPEGIYLFWAALDDTSLVVMKESLNVLAETKDLGTDTMDTPGAITGICVVNNNPTELVNINITGTSYHATTDSNGYFLMTAVYPRDYKIHFRFEDDLKDIIYETEFDTSVNWGDTTDIDTIVLTAKKEGVPASPDSIAYGYDTLTEVLSLWWSKSVSPDISHYEVYLNNADTTIIKKNIADTSFSFSVSEILEEITDSIIFDVYVHSIDSGNNKSTVASPTKKIVLLCSSYVETYLSFKNFPDPFDTTLIETPINFYISYNNPTRKIKSIICHDLTSNDTLSFSTPNKKSGIDSLEVKYSHSGIYKIHIEAIDVTEKSWYSKVETLHVYDSKHFRPENIWVTCSDINNRRKEHSSAALGNEIYILGGSVDVEVGGFKRPSVLKSIESANAELENISNWETYDSLPMELRYSASITLNSKIFIIGGLSVNYEASSSVFIYDSLSKKWSEEDILPNPLFAMSACTLGGKIFILGGMNSNSNHTDNIYRLNPETLKIEEAGKLLSAKSFHQSVSDGSCIYTLGGSDNIDLYAISDMEKFIPSIGSTPYSNLPQNRMLFGAELIDGHIYCIGGINDIKADIGEGTALKTVDVYNANQNLWIKAKDMPESLYSFSTVVIDGLVYITGGSNYFPSIIESYKTYCYYPFKEKGEK